MRSATAQIRSRPSCVVVAICGAVGDQRTLRCEVSPAVTRATVHPLVVAETRTVRSAATVASQVPSGDQATA